MLDIAIQVLTTISIAAVSSLITVQFSLRKFRSERWWERKAEAYSRIIEVLHNAKAFAASHIEAEEKGRELPEEQDEALRRRSKVAFDEILKVSDIGAFLLSDDAIERLRLFQKKTEEASSEETWFEYLEKEWSATDKCLKDLIQIAKRDLKTK